VRVLHTRAATLEGVVAERTEALRDAKDRTEQALITVASQAARLRALDAARSRFFANASHELRTPLTLIDAPLQDLEEDHGHELPAGAAGQVHTARRAVGRLTRLVDQLLDVTRLEGGRLRFRPGPLDAIALLREQASAFVSVAIRAGVALDTELPDGGVPLLADGDQIEKVVTNLLANALHFTPRGGRVVLEASRDAAAHELRIRVRDSGTGIPAEHLPRIFEPFFQGDDSPSGAGGGMGVGLALARELVELHGGRIEAESVPGEGSVFSFWLPLPKPGSVDPDTAVRPDAVRGAGEPPPWTATLLPAYGGDAAGTAEGSEADEIPTVIVVEDNDELRAYLRDSLALRYRVLEAGDGRAGLELARRVVPDLVITDLMMPVMDGGEFCRLLKADPELDFVPVLILTARADAGSRVDRLEEGADDYLVKPFQRRELLARIHNLIASRRRLRERFRGERRHLPVLAPPVVPDDAGDRLLLEQVYRVLAEHVADEGFGIEQLARGMRMSRATLYRRLHALLPDSPGELIWRYRLEQAASWLNGTDASVAEVAYAVGFRSVPHFCTRFRARFGVSPAAYRQRSRATPPAAHA
jgi:signal transduction histidine kinase/CheY-like chemotaxis protein/AraC-like DNA-binding protein